MRPDAASGAPHRTRTPPRSRRTIDRHAIDTHDQTPSPPPPTQGQRQHHNSAVGVIHFDDAFLAPQTPDFHRSSIDCSYAPKKM